MTLCGVRCGRLKCLFKWLVNCVHNACAFFTNIKQMNNCLFCTFAKITFWRFYFVKFE